MGFSEKLQGRKVTPVWDELACADPGFSLLVWRLSNPGYGR